MRVLRGMARPDTLEPRGDMEAMEDIARGIEWIGVAIIVVALALSAARALRDLARGTVGIEVYRRVRAYFGRGILLGVETLVAADLIRTVAVQPTLENVLVLALIVLVRTLLSFSLDIEIEGVVPWRKGAVHPEGSPTTPPDTRSRPSRAPRP